MDLQKLDRHLSLSKIIFVTIVCVSMVMEVLSDACNTPCSCEMETEGLIVNCAARELTAVPADIPKETVILRLSDNSISSVNVDDFKYLGSLQRLYLDGNSLRSDMISVGAFQNLENLEYLDLSDNRIRPETSHMTALLQPLTSLIWLDLSDNNIPMITQGMITIFDRLQTLTLTGNALACNCDILWLKNWLLNTRFAPPIVNGAECYSPSSLRRQQVAYAQFCPGAGRCYQCNNAASNEACTSIQDCSADQDACQNVIRTSNGVKRISKGCQQLQACLNNNGGNLDNCDTDQPDSACWHCCQGDLCNMPETAVVIDGCRVDQTPDRYVYRYPWPRVPNSVTAVTFKLRANNDGHIALSDERVDKDKLIEVVLGGWKNTKSVIRSCKQCSPLAEASTPDLLMSPTEDKHFYITFEGSVINVGIVGMAPILSHQFDEEPIINFIGISTGWGSTGQWTFCGYGKKRKRSKRESRTACPEGWSTHGDYCYYVSSEEAVTFGDAQTACLGKNAMLTSIHDQDEQEFISDLVAAGSGHKWIGLNDIDVEGTFTWIDGTQLDFEFWAIYQPDNDQGMEDCVHLKNGGSNTGLWNDIPCSDTYKYICKKSQANPEPSPSPSGPDQPQSPVPEGQCAGKENGLYPDPEDCMKFYACSDNGQSEFHISCDTNLVFKIIFQRAMKDGAEFNNECYLFQHSDEYVSYVDAKTQCSLLDAQLAVIHSQEEQDFIAANIHEDPNNELHSYYIGLDDIEIEGQFQWVDGTPLDFTDWKQGEPNNRANNIGNGEDCVGLWASRGGIWNDNPCTRLNPYICEKSLANECLSNPCHNGGVCIDEIDDYHCKCDGTGYKGTRCQDVSTQTSVIIGASAAGVGILVIIIVIGVVIYCKRRRNLELVEHSPVYEPYCLYRPRRNITFRPELPERPKSSQQPPIDMSDTDLQNRLLYSYSTYPISDSSSEHPPIGPHYENASTQRHPDVDIFFETPLKKNNASMHRHPDIQTSGTNTPGYEIPLKNMGNESVADDVTVPTDKHDYIEVIS
ncbi:uncharacterized protein [Amphiura filiformis]|uniref:uncharacterized protein isoform X3 n=1 Tax=Amphiura filiformis TaxID=82378 RepID=UPI003B211E3D